PVRVMLERDAELKIAGARPSAYARVKVGAKKDGTIVAWQSESWGTGGPGGGGMPPIPYVFTIPNQRKQHTAIRNNIGPPWAGRGHASGCDLTSHPDGSVDLKLGSQDLGTGTRTCILMVTADALGTPMEGIQLHVGDTSFPRSGGSGGSTTMRGVNSSTRRG